MQEKGKRVTLQPLDAKERDHEHRSGFDLAKVPTGAAKKKDWLVSSVTPVNSKTVSHENIPAVHHGELEHYR